MTATTYPTKAARDRDARAAGRDYDRLKDQIIDTLRGTTDVDMIWDLPYSAKQWKPKHSEMFRAVAADTVDAIETMAANVRAICDTPVVKAPAKPSKQRAANDARREPCQICGRMIVANAAGAVADHGYRQLGNGSHFTGCYGQRHPSLRHSTDRLVAYIEMLVRSMDKAETDREARAIESEIIVQRQRLEAAR